MFPVFLFFTDTSAGGCVQASSSSSGYVQPLSVTPRPPSQPLTGMSSLRPALVSPAHYTLLPPSAQYVCQPTPVQVPVSYRLVGAHGQELPISGLTYQLMAPQPSPHAMSATAVQLIPAAPVAEVYPASQQTTYLQPESAVHSAASGESEPVFHVSVEPKYATTRYIDSSYQVIQPSAADASLSYGMSSCEMPLQQSSQQQVAHASSSLSQTAVSSRHYEDSPEYYPPQSTFMMTSLHPAGSRPLLTGALRQPLPVIISGMSLRQPLPVIISGTSLRQPLAVIVSGMLLRQPLPVIISGMSLRQPLPVIISGTSLRQPLPVIISGMLQQLAQLRQRDRATGVCCAYVPKVHCAVVGTAGGSVQGRPGTRDSVAIISQARKTRTDWPGRHNNLNRYVPGWPCTEHQPMW